MVKFESSSPPRNYLVAKPLFHHDDQSTTIAGMGRLLERAIEEAQKLSDDEQEAIGAWLLAEIESERRWDQLFSRPPSEAL